MTPAADNHHPLKEPPTGGFCFYRIFINKVLAVKIGVTYIRFRGGAGPRMNEGNAMINVIEAAARIEKENAEFGYVAGKLEIANDIWKGFLSPAERLEIMNATNIEGLSTLEKLRACVKTLAAMF